jgi:hypothetical protein
MLTFRTISSTTPSQWPLRVSSTRPGYRQNPLSDTLGLRLEVFDLYVGLT